MRFFVVWSTMPMPAKTKRRLGAVSYWVQWVESEYDFERMWPASLLSLNELLLWSKGFSTKKKQGQWIGPSCFPYLRSIVWCFVADYPQSPSETGSPFVFGTQWQSLRVRVHSFLNEMVSKCQESTWLSLGQAWSCGFPALMKCLHGSRAPEQPYEL